ncbi:cysteine hydrolase family protein [Rhizobium sp. SSA_523]|uniref:cysteine hydrolase family protein n=1 Tax=Rhizobium sp. SSA_523 TaxID=2952477 RepID=UPI0020905C9D|nr:isochorismatase family cysteine hydrolase [Rhizobium sp. SSA_523]MCO5731740.1 cysteine hydrolase [Rhizobium sp. SSA_523]WKC22888.1 isochorismatase family cysteine hydrolase [Rhizobium sp. SSA_523]
MQGPGTCFHLCVDMQRMFAEDTPWHIPWMQRVREPLAELARVHAQSTIFTRFVPPMEAAEANGMWRSYFRKWSNMTRRALGEEMIDLLPELRALVPPALVFDKAVYSPWQDGRLHRFLVERKVDTLVITGGETDVCVLAAVLGAVDHGYRNILVSDAICSGSDETHDDSLDLFARRFSAQLQLMTTQEVLDWWR